MQRAILTGLCYFAPVMVAAFALGVIRVTLVVPALGSELAAVAIEVPIILIMSWLVAGAVLRRQELFSEKEAWLIGATAFAVLMVSELVLARLLAGQSADEWFAQLRTNAGLLGIAGQLLFAFIPAIRNRAAASPRG